MSAFLPIRHVVRLARVFGLVMILSALLATPVECLCGDPYPSAHALLEFIVAPRSIIMKDDGMPGMPMSEHTEHHRSGDRATSSTSSPSMASDVAEPAMDSGMAPTIRDDGGHLERAGSYSAIAGLILVALVALSRRAATGSSRIWRGLCLQPATPPPRFLLTA